MAQEISTPDNELVIVTNIIPTKPDSVMYLQMCHDGEPADSTLKAGKAVDPRILCYKPALGSDNLCCKAVSPHILCCKAVGRLSE